MSGPTPRVLAILELLQSHGLISGAELAQRLGVDRRTVRRYITVLEDMGVPVTTEQGRHGGYMLVPGFKLPPMMFTDEETLAVSLGLLAARQLGLTGTTPAIESVQAKLERVMPANLKQRARGVNETTKLILPRTAPLLDDRVLLTLTRAIQAELRVRFTYRSRDNRDTHREIDPYGLVFSRGHWYMSGFCHLRHAMRSFRLDRISDVQTLPNSFQRPLDFDAAEHFTQSLSALPRNHQVSVLMYADSETAAKTFGWHPNAADLFQQQPDGVLLNTHTDSVDWFSSWLVRLPFSFKILGSPELKTAMREQAQKLMDAC